MKNFLDEHPQDWTNESYKSLQNLLVSYSDVSGIAELESLARLAGISSGTFPEGHDDARSTAEALILELGRQGKLRKLVEVAAAEETRYKEDFAELLTLAPSSSGAARHPFAPETVAVEAGPFLMGSKPGEGIGSEELDQHEVELDTYHIGKFPVTNAEYAIFLEHNEQFDPPLNGWTAARLRPAEPDNPVSGVTWYEAMAYCVWLTEAADAGTIYTLPSEAQWEKAARGIDGRLYPWGNDWNKTKCNVDAEMITPKDRFLEWASPCQCCDMVGNVPEWTTTLWGEFRRKPDDRYRRPWVKDGRDEATVIDTNDQIRRVTRGGAHWQEGAPVRCAWRHSQLPNRAGIPYLSMGFRVVLLQEGE